MNKKKSIITPHYRLSDFDFKIIWHYRHLLCQLIHRDVVAFYKQTILGPLWFFIQPLFSTIIYVLIFGNFAKVSTDGLPQPLFYLAGIITWNYFSECLNKTSSVFKENAHIFGKVYFPRIIVPLGIVISVFIRFGIQFILFLTFLIIYHCIGHRISFNWSIGLFPLLVLLIAIQGLGIGIIISALTVKYRDLIFLISFGLQLLMYTTTVIYPLSTAPLNLKWIIQINPMTAIIETFRYAFLGRGSFSWQALGYSSTITIIIISIGIIVFHKAEKTFIDTI
ncbi:MAG: ABC transporter permease [Pedobacter sp.]|nr:MAG: ABC transporter permease [Pedobacter sp.]